MKWDQIIPAASLMETNDLVRVLRDVFQIIHRLSSYMHCDAYLKIVSSDLICRRSHGRTIGILANLDYATLDTSFDPTSQSCAVPTPFTVLDLSVGLATGYLYRHDLESLFYAFLWIVCRYRDSVEIPNPPLQAWLSVSDAQLRAIKYNFLCDPDAMERILPDNRRTLSHWLLPLQEMFRKGHDARIEHENEIYYRGSSNISIPFDQETLGGHVTFAEFDAIISIPLNVRNV